jgi:hypothetical protein
MNLDKYVPANFNCVGKYPILFAEDFTSNALLQTRVFWRAAGMIHEKPFLILISAAPQAPAGRDGSKTYLLEKPYRISMKFSIEELASLGYALQYIASGEAERQGIGRTWEKWGDPAKTKSGQGDVIGKKLLSVSSVPQKGNAAKGSVNFNFHCQLPADTPDQRGILKSRKRDGNVIKHCVTVNFGTYAALAVSRNLLSLADTLTDLNRQYRMRQFREGDFGHSAPSSRPSPTPTSHPPVAPTSRPPAEPPSRLHKNRVSADTSNSPSKATATPDARPSSRPDNSRAQGNSGSCQASNIRFDTHLEHHAPRCYGQVETQFAPRPARRIAG